MEVFFDYRSLDLISKKLGETDFIVHPTSTSSKKDTTISEELELEQSSLEIQRTNSDEEDKGLISEELLKSPTHHGTTTTTTDILVAGTNEQDEEDEKIIPSNIPEAVTHILLEDVLILKIENGRDYFLTVSAEFSPTAEGNLE